MNSFYFYIVISITSIDIVNEEKLPGELTRAEYLTWLENFLSRPPEDDESRRPNITYDNCLMYYPSIDTTLNN